MSSWGAGLLAVASGAGAGMAGAVKEEEKKKRESSLEEKKQAALYAKQQNLLRLEADLREQGKVSDRAYQDQVREGDREYQAGVRKEEMSFQKQQAADAGLRAQNLAELQQDLKNNAPTDLEKKYDLLSEKFGEEEAKAMIKSSIVNKGRGKGDTELDYRELWGKTYTNALKALNEDFSDKRTPEEKDRAAREMADRVTGFAISGQGGRGGDGETGGPDLATLIERGKARAANLPKNDEPKPKPGGRPAGAEEANVSDYSGYSGARISNGYVWATDANGQGRRLFKVEEPKVRYGAAEYENRKYPEYLKKLEQLGLKG